MMNICIETMHRRTKWQTEHRKQSAKKSYKRNFNYGESSQTAGGDRSRRRSRNWKICASLRFEPEYYHDFMKMNELDEKIDKVHVEIDHLMATWEEYSEHLE